MNIDKALDSRLVKLCAGAIINGGVAFLGVWASTDEVKILVTAGMLPFLSTFATFFGINAAVSGVKAVRANGTEGP